MSTESDIKLWAQIVALRFMVADIMAVLAAASGDADKFTERLRRAATVEAQHVTFPGSEPVTDDAFCPEVESAVDFLWSDVVASIARLREGAKRS